MARLRSLCVVLLGLIMMGGCASQEWRQVRSYVADLIEPGDPAAGTDARSRRAADRAAVRTPPERRGSPPRSVEPYDPGRLVGQSGAAVQALLGPPAAERDQGSGLVWSYRTGKCELDVVLYSSVDGRDLRVLQYRVDGHVPDRDPDGAACVGRMVRDAPARQS